MPSLGSISFITLKGHMALGGLQIEDISREGTDGSAYRKRQYRAEPFQMLGFRDCDTLSDAQAKFDSLVDMQGTSVSLTDDYGVTWTKTMVLDVKKVGMGKLVAAVGGVSSSKGAYLAVALSLQLLPNG
jgi:hypothetical protein